MKTRTQLFYLLNSCPSTFVSHSLPIRLTVLKRFVVLSDANENFTIAKVADLVSREIEDIWIRSNIPYQNRRETVKMIQKLYDEYKLVKKNIKRPWSNKKGKY